MSGSSSTCIFGYKTKLCWAEGSFSDPLMLMHAFDAFPVEKENNISDDVNQFRRLVEAHYVYENLKQHLAQTGFSEPQTPNLKKRDGTLQNFFVMMALCGAFYPYYGYTTARPLSESSKFQIRSQYVQIKLDMTCRC